ncbi:hypothetical protein FB451DRAFT_1483076 [Mycena latifolia]|nr:hypothetical protein FB451DRAFT_1483076 [Mycena latifolia]
MHVRKGITAAVHSAKTWGTTGVGSLVSRSSQKSVNRAKSEMRYRAPRRSCFLWESQHGAASLQRAPGAILVVIPISPRISPSFTMATSRNPPPSSGIPQQRGKNDFGCSRLHSPRRRRLLQAAECIPFPYVKGVFGTVVVILETVKLPQKVKKNRDDLKELCENIMEIISIIQDQLSSHGDTAAVKFKGLCEDLEGVLQGVLNAVKQLQTKPRGFTACFKEVMKLNNTSDEISGHRTRIQELRLNFLVTAAIDTNLQVSKVLQLSSGAPSMKFSFTSSSSTGQYLPSTHANFHGRQAILHSMHQYFTQNLGKQDIFLLHGLGGAGKTQTALKFIQDSTSHFTDIVLIDSNTVETIEMGLKISPHCTHGNILITSRNPGLCVYADAHAHVADMEEPDTVALLLRRAAQYITDHGKGTATQIVKVLYYLPLAIIQAGAFVSQSGNLDSYLSLYSHNRARLLAQRSSQSHDDYAWTVYTTWQISFNQLSEPAKTLLQLCSFLHYQEISENIFKNAANCKDKISGISKDTLEMPLKVLSHFLGPSGSWDPLCFMGVTNEIRAYSLVNFDSEKKMLSMHPLVHEWTRSTLSDTASYHRCISIIAGMSLASLSERDLNVATQWMLPHIDSLMKWSSNGLPDFAHQYGKAYVFGGKLDQSKELQVMVLERRQTLLGEDHPDTLDAVYWLAWAYEDLGLWKEAEEVLVVVLEKRRHSLGDEHPDTLDAMEILAVTYANLGKFEEAEKFEIGLLQKRKSLQGDNDPATLTVMGNLACLYQRLGRFREAKELRGKLNKAEELEILVLKKWQKIIGDSHPDTLLSMANLSFTYYKQGKLTEAEVLALRVLEKRRNILGDSHPLTLLSMANLGLLYNELGRLQEAEELEILVLEKRRNIFGVNHPDTLRTMSNLGSTFNKLERWQEAEELLTTALQKQSEFLSDIHPHLVDTRQRLAVTYIKLGKLDQTEDLNMALTRT